MKIINFLRGKLSIAMVSAIVTVASGPVYAESIAVSPTLGFDAVRFDANVFALRGNSATNKNSTHTDGYWSPKGSPFIGEPKGQSILASWASFVPASNEKDPTFDPIGDFARQEFDMFDPDNAIVLLAEGMSGAVSKKSAPNRVSIRGFTIPLFNQSGWSAPVSNLNEQPTFKNKKVQFKLLSEFCPPASTPTAKTPLHCRVSNGPAAKILWVLDYIVNSLRFIFGSYGAPVA